MKISTFVGFICLLTFNLHAQKKGHIKGDLLVQFVDNQSVSRNFEQNKYHLISKKCLSKSLHIWQLTFDENANEKTLLASFQEDPSVKTAQFNHYVNLRTTIPNDPNFKNQWHLLNTGQNSGVVGADAKITQAWDITTGGVTPDGDTIVVAVIDNGTELTHPDLAANLWVNRKEIPNNGLDDDGNGYVDDYWGWNPVLLNDDVRNINDFHGLGVEGVIGAVGNNGLGGSGVNWNVKIMTLKFGELESQIVAAYDYAYTMRRLYNETNGKKGAFVVASNSSFGQSNLFPKDAPLWCSFFDSLGKVGILNIVAADNANVFVDSVGDLPTTCPSDFLVAVTSTNRFDRFGNRAFGVVNVDVAAPGEEIYTTGGNGTTIVDYGNSVACPIVSGVVALAYSTPCSDFINFAKSEPAKAALFLKDKILNSVDVLPVLVGKVKSGGRVNAFKMLQQTLSFCGTCNQPTAVKLDANLTSVTLNFKSPNASVKARYRKIENLNWTDLGAKNTPLSILGLEACQEYQVELISDCGGTLSSPYFYNFKTSGCCSKPDNPLICNVLQSQISLKYAKVNAANSYKICLKENQNDVNCVVEKIVSDTFLTFNNLKFCQKYEILIKAVCDNKSSLDTFLTVQTKGCGACFDQNYCKPKALDSRFEWIDSFAISTLKNKSGNNGGFAQFDSISTTLKAGQKYKIAVKPGFGAGVSNENLRVWIDYNGDGIFDETTEKIWEIARFQDAKTDSIYVPQNLRIGITKLRVALSHRLLSLACDNVAEGEIEDYCVRIESDTSIPFTLLPSDIAVFPNPFSQQLTIVNRNPANRILNFNIMRLDGTTVYSNDVNFNEIETVLTNLPPLSIGLYFIKIETEKGFLVKKIVRY